MFRLVIAESLLLTVIGGVLGVVGSMAFLSSTGLSVAAEGVTIAFRPSWELATQGIVIAFVVGLIAGLAPGWQASQIADRDRVKTRLDSGQALSISFLNTLFSMSQSSHNTNPQTAAGDVRLRINGDGLRRRSWHPQARTCPAGGRR